MRYLATALRAEPQAGDTSDALYAEGLYMVLIVRLLDNSRDSATGAADRASTLALRVAMRVIDYIEIHLHVCLTLAELAV